MTQGFPSHFSLTHVATAALVVLFLVIGAFNYWKSVSGGGKDALIPPSHMSLRNIFEMFADGVLSTAEGVMGPVNARRFLPLIGTFAFFIFFSNILALIPGFIPPTAALKTNVALGVMVFLITHFYGFKDGGIKYLAHFLGPVWWLSPLMLPIELIGHLARPVSLSLRLLGNIAADHKVVSAFFAMVPLLVPVPFLILGTLVCIVQTLVFSLLAMVYIQGAVEHDHGDDHGEGHGDGHGHEHAHAEAHH
jgi:F-type H+-transporting ATPase subunit a